MNVLNTLPRFFLCVAMSCSVAVPVYARGFCGGGGRGGGGFDRGGGGFDRGGGGFDRGGSGGGFGGGRDRGNSDRGNMDRGGSNSFGSGDRGGSNSFGSGDRGGFGNNGNRGGSNDGGFGNNRPNSGQGQGLSGRQPNYTSGFDDWGNKGNSGRGISNPNERPTFGGGFGNIPSRPTNRNEFANGNHDQFNNGNMNGFRTNGTEIGHNNNNVRAVDNHELNVQGQGVRNSFNHVGNNYTFNNFGGYHNGGWGGYPIYGFNSAAAWTMFGVSTATSMLSFLGIAMMVSSSGKNKSQTVAATPVSSGNVTYNYGNVYVNGQPSGSSQQYYQQAQQLASGGYNLPQNLGGSSNSSSSGSGPGGSGNTNSGGNSSNAPNQNEWKPLGVFALGDQGQKDANMLLQLQINADGKVAGEYLNQLTGESSPVFGALDKQTQRISWTIGKNTKTVFDAGLGDLMKQDSTVLVHYGPDSTQRMALIRLEKPKDLPPPQET